MAGAMVHRGPDDQGIFTSGPVGLAHRRLSIIDVKTGHQPMFNEDDSIAIVFNGEIYNHRNLRAALELKGHCYRTNSDTESILHAYEEYGHGFETHLTGMFAFALWDEKHQKLILSRDRLGIKPLYYTIHRGQLIFASEIKAILTVEGVERRVDLESLGAFLSLRYVPGPRTMFQNIFKLQPGHTLSIHGGLITDSEYWDIRFQEEDREERQIIEQLTSLLFEICDDHLMSEVPYGVFLSGGIDSSAVSCILRKILKERVTTFTVGYENARGINEFNYAKVVSDFVGTNHFPLSLRAEDFAEWIPQLVWHLDEPVGDDACIPLYFLARYAKRQATVLHSGEGADELFGGYSIYKKMGVLNAIQGPLSGTFARVASRGVLPFLGNSKLARYVRALGQPLEERYRGVSGHFMEGMKEQLVKPEVTQEMARHLYLKEVISTYYKKVEAVSDLNRMLYLDTKMWLPDDLLIKADKMTMAASVELRVPFLDHRLIEFAARLPVNFKVRNGETKYILKKVMEPYLPREVIYRTKKGFPVPAAAWFRNELHKLTSEVLLRPNNAISRYLNVGTISGMIKQHNAGTRDYAHELWGLLILEFWFEKFGVQ